MSSEQWHCIRSIGHGAALPLAVSIGLVLLARALIPVGLEPSDHDTQPRYSAPAPIDMTHRRVGQTFLASTDNLAAIAVFVRSPGSQQPHTLEFRLLREGDASPIVTRAVSLAGVNPGDFVTVDFAPVRGSRGVRFTFELEGDANTNLDPVILGATDWDSYPDGYALTDGARRPGDLSFTAYSSPTALDIVWRGMTSLWGHAAAIIALLVVVLAASSVVWHFVQPSEKGSLTLAAAVLCASPLLLPVCLLLFSAVGLSFSPILLIGAGTGLWLWRTIQRRSLLPRGGQPAEWIGLLTAALLVLVIQADFIAGQTVPAYVDSVHHVAIIRTIAANGMLPPFMPSQGSTAPFFYHFGAHALSASITMLSAGAISPEEALLVEGPVVLLLYALGTYALVRALGCGHWPGLAAMMLATFALSMPTYLLNWGRYPLLLAMATLGGTLSLLICASKPGVKPQVGVIAGLLIGGNMLAHTRMTFVWPMAACAGAALVWRAVRAPRKVLVQLAPIWITALMVMLVWLLPRWATSAAIPKSLPGAVSVAAGAGPQELVGSIDPRNLIEPIWAGLLLVGALALIRQPGSPPRLGMIAAILVLRAVSLLRIRSLFSGALLDDAFSDAATSFAVIAALGTVVGDVQKVLNLRWQAPPWSAALVAAALAAAGLSARPTAPSQCCELATASDVETLSWIGRSVPATSTIGIAAVDWPGDVVVGLDGGYWISEMTGRFTTLPNMLMLYETRGARWQAIRERALTVDTAIRLRGAEVCELDIDYVYMGGTGGSFDLPTLESNPHLRLVHRNERTALFQVIGCAAP